MLEDMEVSDIESDFDFGDDCITSRSECSSATDHLSWMDRDGEEKIDRDGEEKMEEDEDEIEEEALAAGQRPEGGESLLYCQAKQHWQESTREGLVKEMARLKMEAKEAADQEAELPQDVRPHYPCMLLW
jgi:hypothetical protein